MKILEITNYTSGGCGVGMRVLKEAVLLSERGHKVVIFSTNKIKGSNSLCSVSETIKSVLIRRFPSKRIGGESYMKWNFENEAINFNPDVIIAHAYRHTHTTQALKIAKKLRCKVILVTHAPFARQESRSLASNLSVRIYDFLIGRKSIKMFDKVIAITKWELPYLKNLGLSDKKIAYIPNGIDKVFFKPLKNKGLSKEVKLIYTGRIAPIKQLETIIFSIKSLKNVSCLIRGPAEIGYLNELKRNIKEKQINTVKIEDKSYSKEEQISLLDKSDIFILPSKSEGMPQTLLEAMARGKIIVASNILGNKDLIIHGKNGFLFANGDANGLISCIKHIITLSQKEITSLRMQARKTAEKFKWENIIGKLEEIANK